MGSWKRFLPGIALCAGSAGALEIQHWSGAFRISIWDVAYDRGLGGIAGVETHLAANVTAALQLGYSHFEPHYDLTEAVDEIEARVGLKREFHPTEENFVYPRLGVHAGASRNFREKWHVVAGVDAEAVIPVSKPWSILFAFQPSYAIGEKNDSFWRVALGFLYDAR
jgi:hypothetical protein